MKADLVTREPERLKQCLYRFKVYTFIFFILASFEPQWIHLLNMLDFNGVIGAQRSQNRVSYYWARVCLSYQSAKHGHVKIRHRVIANAVFSNQREAMYL